VRRRRLVGSLTGRGHVTRRSAQTALGAVQYQLQIWQDFIDASSLEGRAELPGLKSIEGRISGLGGLGLVGEELTLSLEDGSYFDFFFTDLTGRIAAQGGFYRR
jgi:hypothetical protein